MTKIISNLFFAPYLCGMKNSINLFIIILLLACNDKPQRSLPILASITESVYASGTVKSENQYEAFSPITGIIDSIYVLEGDAISKGRLILSVANDVQRLTKENAALAATFSDFQANEGKLKQAQAFLKFSKSKMANDSLMYVRQQNLWRLQIGSKAALEERELAYQNSKASYVSSIVSYNDLKRQLQYNASQTKKQLLISEMLASDYLVKSKMNGIVYSINKNKGEIVGPQTPLAVIGDAKNFVLEMQVDEYDILKIRKGMTVIVTLDSYKGTVFNAVVTKINPLMNERSRTFVVEAKFTNPPELLYPNISFEANIVLAKKDNALLVPRNYVFDDSMVFKSNGDKVVVKTGLKDYQKIEILSGINKADELIIPTE